MHVQCVCQSCSGTCPAPQRDRETIDRETIARETERQRDIVGEGERKRGREREREGE